MGNISSSAYESVCLSRARCKYLELKRSIRDLDQQTNLELHKQEILDILSQSGFEILKEEPQLLHELLMKAGRLIPVDPENYAEIIKEMADIYKTIPDKPQMGPLTCLMQQIHEDWTWKLIDKSEAVFCLIKALVHTDSPNTRTACLRLIIMKAKYISTQDELAFQWTSHLTRVLSVLLREGADPTEISQNDENCTLSIFFQTLPIILAKEKHLTSNLMELLQLFLTEKCLNHWEPNGTLLHAMVNCNWIDLQEDTSIDLSQCKEIITTIAEASPALLDKPNKEGQTALDILTEYICEHPTVGNQLFTLLPLLTTKDNASKPDILLKLVSQASNLIEVTDCIEVFQKLVEIYETIPSKPREGPLSFFMREMENMEVKYTLLRKRENQTKFVSLIMMFLTVENSVPLRLWEVNKTLKQLEDLDPDKKEILVEQARKIFTKRPEIFLDMVQQTHAWVNSIYHVKMMKKMADAYRTIPNRPAGTLNFLIQEMSNIDSKITDVTVNGEEFLSFIKVLIPNETTETRTHFLMFVITAAKYTSGNRKKMFWWTSHFINFLISLLQEGADPTWRPQNDDKSVLYMFFETLPILLAKEKHLTGEIKQLLQLFLTKKYLNHSEPDGTVLHALFSCNWTDLLKDSSIDLSQGKEIITTIAGTSPSILEKTDKLGRTALFIANKLIFSDSKLGKTLLTFFPVQHLITEKNANNPIILLKMLRRTTLIHSTYYFPVVEKLVDIYKTIQDKPTKGPLRCLMQQMDDEQSLLVFAKSQELFFALIKTLMEADDTEMSRNECLRLLVMNARHISTIHELSFIWQRNLTDTLANLLKEGADPTWRPEDDAESALYIFFQRIFILLENETHVRKELMELLPFFLTDHEEPRVTALHVLVTRNWEDFPDGIPIELCKEIICKIVTVDSALMDKTDKEGQTALDILTEYICEHPTVGNQLFTLLPLLITKDNASKPEILLRLVSQASSLIEHTDCIDIFQKLADIYNTIQDKPEKGPLTCFMKLMDDRKSTCALNQNPKSFVSLTRLLVTVEDPNPLRLWKLKSALGKVEDLDPEEVEKVENHVRKLLTQRPTFFMEMIREAHMWLESPNYVKIVKIMAEVYRTIPVKPKDGPLDMLMLDMHEEKKMKTFSMHQEEFLSLIEVFISMESDLTRTKLLRHLMMTAEYTKGNRTSKLKWTTKFLDILEQLFEGGADPTWRPQDNDESALYIFFHTILIITASKPTMTEDLMKFLKLFITDKYLKHIEQKGNVLHALVSCNWIDLHERGHAAFSEYCEDIILKVVKVNSALLDMTDEGGQTPLDLLTRTITQDPKLGQRLLKLFPLQHLITDKNASDSDRLLKILKRTRSLLDSAYFEETIKGLVVRYNRIPTKPEESPLDCLMQQMHDKKSLDAFKENQMAFLNLVKILVTMDDPHAPRDKCLRLLILNAKHTSNTPCIQWTVQLVQTVKLLLHKGADPAWVPDRGYGSVLLRYVQNVFLILAAADREPRLKAELMDLLERFLDEKYLRHSENKGNVLHALVSGPWDNLPINLRTEFISQCKKLIYKATETNPTLPDMTNQDGDTALDILARKIYDSGLILGSHLESLVKPLVTEANVNNQNKAKETPYSWILMGKVKHEKHEKSSKDNNNNSNKNNTHSHNLFSNIESIFTSEGGDANQAKAGAARPILKWMKQELGNADCSHNRLQHVLYYMREVKNWKPHLSAMRELNRKAKENMKRVSHPMLISIIIEIMKVFVTNQLIAFDIWKGIFPEYMEDATPGNMEMLRICAERRAVPTVEQRDEIISSLKALTREQEFAIPLLKIFLSFENKDFIPNLTFMEDFYIVSEEMIQLGRKLIRSMFTSLASCLESESLTHCFLYVKDEEEIREVIEQGFFSDSIANNWLKRQFLHLAVIFLESLSFLPYEIIKAHLNDKDIHGCTPLHVAYIHQNTETMQHLLSCGADENILDQFRLKPNDLRSRVMATLASEGSIYAREDHPDVTYHKLCHEVFQAESGVLEICRPMMVFPKEAEELTNELRMLFQRLLTGTDFEKAEVVVAGSLREKLKSGRLNEGDVQLRFNGYSEYKDVVQSCYIHGKHWYTNDFLKQLSDNLISQLDKISWKGINLRPICIKGPWKCIREGKGAYNGMLVSVDVVPILVNETKDDSILKPLQEFLKDAPVQSRMEVVVMETWKRNKECKATLFASELVMIDHLPKVFRLAIVIAKTLLQVYKQAEVDNVNSTMPITSYTIKTALFYLLAYKSGQPEFRASGKISTKGVRALTKVLAKVLGKDKKRKKLKFSRHVKIKWTTDSDVNFHKKKARIWACKMFELINCLAQRGWKLANYWNRGDPVQNIKLYGEYGEAAFIKEICESVLERLSKKIFIG